MAARTLALCLYWRAKARPRPPTNTYAKLPATVRAAFDAAIDKRAAPTRRYQLSDQPCFAAVCEQSGAGGYKRDRFAVEVHVHHTKKLRLGMVGDSRLGAFLWCAHKVDPDTVCDADATRAWMRTTMADDVTASPWLRKVQDRIATIEPPKGRGGRPRTKAM